MSRRPPPKDRSAHERGRRATVPQSEGRGPFRAASPDLVTLYGAHAVRAALTARKRKLLTLYASETALPRINELALAAGLEPRLVDARDLERRLGPEAVHQGLLLEARPLPEADISDIVSVSGVVLALDQITDPHNVGAILRTACAFNVDAVIVTERHSPEFSGVLAKAASGALEFTTIVSVVNLARALDDTVRLAALAAVDHRRDARRPARRLQPLGHLRSPSACLRPSACRAVVASHAASRCRRPLAVA